MAEKNRGRADGEYRIVRPERENRFADADYIPQSEAPEIRRTHAVPSPAEPKPEKPRRGISAGTVVALCLICGVLGGAAGGLGVGWYMTRIRPVTAVEETAELPAPERSLPESAETAPAAAEESVIGIFGETVSPSVARYYDMVQGVYVWSVSPGSAAEQAGLCAGDVITALGDTPVQSVEALQEAVRECGERALLTLSRAGKSIETELVFG